MRELTLFPRGSKDSEALIAAESQSIISLNILTSKNGLMLSARDAREIAETHHKALRENERIEIGGGAVEKLILVFASSLYVEPRNWAELVDVLVESFYFIKSETHDVIHDNELIRDMLEQFESCDGSIELFKDRLESLIRRINGGVENE